MSQVNEEQIRELHSIYFLQFRRGNARIFNNELLRGMTDFGQVSEKSEVLHK